MTEGDRQAQPPVENLIEKAVARIVIGGGVAAKAIFAKQEGRQLLGLVNDRPVEGDALRGRLGQIVQDGHIAGHVQLGIGDGPREMQRRARDVQLRQAQLILKQPFRHTVNYGTFPAVCQRPTHSML